MNKKNLCFLIILITALIVILFSCASSLDNKATPSVSASVPLGTTQPSEIATQTPAQLAAIQNAASAEQYNIDPLGNHWSYSSSGFSVDIKKIHDGAQMLTYFVADISIYDDHVIQTGFSDKNLPGSSPADPSEIARSYGAVYAQNGDYFSWPKNNKGIVIRNGLVLYNQQQEADTLAFFPDGTIKVFKPGETTAQQLQSKGVENALSFGPILVNNAIINPDMNQSKVYSVNTRSGFGMVSKNHFIAIVTEGTGIDGSHGITLDDFSKLFLSYHCTVAYNFDGGQSAAMIFMGKPLNTHTEMNGILFRKVPDILIVGTSSTVGK